MLRRRPTGVRTHVGGTASGSGAVTVAGYAGSELSRRALEYGARRVGPGGRIILGGSARLSCPSEETRGEHLERGSHALLPEADCPVVVVPPR